ncbi:homeobox-leucine zipper protein HAT22-like [Arachis stenosperma]|uniref:homeobox-leucine zipper protein HAT22-like n=1 Tax=Arachis stenosperma TaxID=217475 RepID=UPI0025AC85F2|nr:homeobox-leucine zipper protein HAT22-like [Arachis stenosperma]
MGLHHDSTHNNNNSGLHLVLGLALSSSSDSPTQETITTSTKIPPYSSSSTVTTDDAELLLPSLTLALSGHDVNKNKNDDPQEHHRVQVVPTKANNNKVYSSEDYPSTGDVSAQNSPHHSAVSSFSSGCRRGVKRERDVSASDEAEAEAEATEIERLSSRISDEEEDGGTTASAAARKKLRLTKEQSALLEDSFKQHSTLNPKQKQALAMQLNLRPRQVEVWFQNRRARTKLKQTEVDCEFLKKCCETLTDENRRLQKELQELKALKLSQHLYMPPMPAATLTICPSCDRAVAIGSGGSASNNIKNTPLISMAPKPHHFFSPFTNPSAAC